MRDIDFEELDKAVNNYLETGETRPVQFSKEDVSSEIESQIERANEKREMIFASRKAPEAANLHSNLIKKEETQPMKIVDIAPAFEKPKTEEKKKAKVKILDDFKPPVPPEHHRENFGVPVNKVEDFAFESPVLETISFEKPTRASKKIENAPVRKKNFQVGREKISLSAPQREEAKVLPRTEGISIKDVQPIQSQSRADFYAGVYKIKDDEELKVFGKNHEDEKTEVFMKNITPRQSVVAENVEENSKNDFEEKEFQIFEAEEKVLPEIGETKKVDALDFIPKEEKNEEDSSLKISVRTEELTPEETERPEEKPTENFEKVESAPISTFEKSEEDKKPEKVIIQSVDLEDDVLKTPFVQNPKIEKRPLGSPTVNVAGNLEFKKPVSTPQRTQKSTIVKDLKEAKAKAPLLASDEYSAPVKQKKKSGWGVVVAILLILLIGGGAGLLAAMLLF